MCLAVKAPGTETELLFELLLLSMVGRVIMHFNGRF